MKRSVAAVLMESSVRRIAMAVSTDLLCIDDDCLRRQRGEWRKRKLRRLNSQLTDHTQVLPLFGLGEYKERRTFFFRPASPSSPMDIRIGIRGQLVMNDLRDIGDVQTARRHIRRDKRADAAGPEGAQGPFPLRLAVVSGNRSHGGCLASQFGRKTADLILLVAENH